MGIILWLIGLATGLCVRHFYKKILTIKWYYILLIIFTYLIAVLGILFVHTSIVEYEYDAAKIGTAMFSIISILLVVVIYKFAFKGEKVHGN